VIAKKYENGHNSKIKSYYNDGLELSYYEQQDLPETEQVLDLKI